MEGQDVRMSSISPIPPSEHGGDERRDLRPSSHGLNHDNDHHQHNDDDEQGLDGDVEFHSSHSRLSPSAESISTGAASSDDEDDEDDEEGEGGEHVDENGAIVIDDDDEEEEGAGESGGGGGGEAEAGIEENALPQTNGQTSPVPKPISIPVLLNQKPLSTSTGWKKKKSSSPSAQQALTAPTTAEASSSTTATNGIELSANTASASTAAAAPGASQKPVSTAKPKSRAKHRSPSPVHVAPPPLQTIRLTIQLGGPENYEVDVAKMAKETGQRPPTPVLQKRADSSESEGEDEDGKAGKKVKEGEGDNKPKKKKKKNAASEYYDVTDPFIDDSELALDDRKFFAQTKQQGFYVSSGEVALMKDRSPKKPPKSTKKTPHPIHTNLDAGPSTQYRRGTGAAAAAEGTKESPIALMDDDDERLPSHPHRTYDTTATKSTRKKSSQANANASSSTASANSNANSTNANANSVVYGTGLAAPVSGNFAITRKLNWMDPDPLEGQGVGPPLGAEDSEAYGMAGDRAGMKRKRVTYSVVTEGGKKRKVVDITSFHPALQASFAQLKEAIGSESWETKGKFPPAIKPILAQVAIQAIKLDEYDEHFFNLMPTLFPYNKFTMSKLIKRTVFAEHTALLVERQDALLAELSRQAKEGFPKAEEEWEKSVFAWDKRQRKLKAEQRVYTGVGTPGGDESASNDGPTRHPSEDRDGLEEGDYPMTTNHTPLVGGAGGSGLAAAVAEKVANGGTDKDAQPPAKKFRLTESMKAIVWELVLLSNECCRLENEKNTLEGSIMQVSEQGLRKVLYQKIVAAFPVGWMSSGQISRDVSAMKKKLEKELLEHEHED